MGDSGLIPESDAEVEEFVELIGLLPSNPMEELEVYASPTELGVYPISVTGTRSWSSEDSIVMMSSAEVMASSTGSGS